jgi:endonuclease YncB( thermonuclease family)
VTAPKPAYVYAAVVNRVIDGDTLRVSVDLGMATWRHDVTVRLLGCNAAERGTPGGDAAAGNLAALLPTGAAVVLRTVKADKFGDRYDAAVTMPDGTDLVATLISTGWAAAWDGRGAKPVPPWPRPAGDGGR